MSTESKRLQDCKAAIEDEIRRKASPYLFLLQIQPSRISASFHVRCQDLQKATKIPTGSNT